MNIFQKILLEREKRNKIATKWNELKDYLKNEDNEDVNKINQAENTIKEVLHIRYGEDDKLWPKKGLATMYKKLKGTNDIFEKLEILQTGKGSDGKGIGYFSDWDDELRGYFKKINLIEKYEKMTVQKLRIEIHKLFKDPKNNELVKKMISLLPDKMGKEGIKYPEWTLVNIQQSNLTHAGLTLWKYGYDDLEFLGQGSYGVVYKDAKNKKVIKYFKDEREARAIGELKKNVFDKNKKAKKYLIDIKGIDSCICEMPLAIGDFFDSMVKKLDLSQKKQTGKKHIENFISHAKSLLKSLKALHDKGFVHNDVKVENVLKLEKNVKDISENKLNNQDIKLETDNNGKIISYTKIKDGKKLKLHKHKLVLADFGTMSKISDELELCNDFQKNGTKLCRMIASSLGYGIPPFKTRNELKNINLDDLKQVTGDEKTIKGRDIWNAGRALFGMLSAKVKDPDIDIYYLVNSEDQEQTANNLWEDIGKFIYVPEDKKSFIESTKIIWEMVRRDPNDRITVDEAYNRFKKLSSHREIKENN